MADFYQIVKGKDVHICSPAASLFHDPEDHVHHWILHLPCDADNSLSGPGLFKVRRSITGLPLGRTSGHLSWHRPFCWLSGQVKHCSISENFHINQWWKWAESCLTANVRAVPHIVHSHPFQNIVYPILQTGVCTISLLRFCHDFGVPGTECLSS